MIVRSRLICPTVPLAAACGSHGTLSILVMESCVHSAVYAVLFFPVNQSAYCFCCYHRVARPFLPMYRFWLYLALHIYNHLKSSTKTSNSCLYFLRNCGCYRQTGDRQTPYLLHRFLQAIYLRLPFPLMM